MSEYEAQATNTGTPPTTPGPAASFQPPPPPAVPGTEQPPSWSGPGSVSAPPLASSPAGMPGVPGGAAPSPGVPGFSVPPPGFAASVTGPAASLPAGSAPPPAQPVAGFPAAPPPRPRAGLTRALGMGLLALLLTVGGGVAGGAIVHATEEPTPTNQAGNVDHAPVLDRSSLASIVSHVKDSVVSIMTQDGTGSGVIFSEDGAILTNNHVVAGASSVRVSFVSGNTVSAKVVGTDPKTDLAVVKVDGVPGLAAATFGNSDTLQVGDTVIAIGSPLGLDGSVTAGIVSGLNRTINETGEQPNPFQPEAQSGTSIGGAIQTDAAINPGNSGGALVNMAGQVVGINTAILTAGQSSGNIGLGFAIPANRATEVARSLIKGQPVSHPYVGLAVGTADGNAGAQVFQVVPNGPAAKAGVQVGDIITKADETDVHTSDDLLNVVQSKTVGSKLTLMADRNGNQTQITVTIGEAPN